MIYTIKKILCSIENNTFKKNIFFFGKLIFEKDNAHTYHGVKYLKIFINYFF